MLVEESASTPWKLLAAHTLQWPSSEESWLRRIHITTNDICGLLLSYLCDYKATVIIECPQIRLDSKGEHAMRTEGIQKLYQQVGCLAGLLVNIVPAVYGVHPQGWKGTLSKEIVKARLIKRLAKQSAPVEDLATWSFDAIEATAMAYWFGDSLKAENKKPPNTSVNLPRNNFKLKSAPSVISTHFRLSTNDEEPYPNFQQGH